MRMDLRFMNGFLKKIYTLIFCYVLIEVLAITISSGASLGPFFVANGSEIVCFFVSPKIHNNKYLFFTLKNS